MAYHHWRACWQLVGALNSITACLQSIFLNHIFSLSMVLPINIHEMPLHEKISNGKLDFQYLNLSARVQILHGAQRTDN